VVEVIQRKHIASDVKQARQKEQEQYGGATEVERLKIMQERVHSKGTYFLSLQHRTGELGQVLHGLAAQHAD
jgi:hypothetical protein